MLEIYLVVDKIVPPGNMVLVEPGIAVGMEKSAIDDGDGHALSRKSCLM